MMLIEVFHLYRPTRDSETVVPWYKEGGKHFNAFSLMSYTCLTHNSDDGDENNSGYDIV